MFPDPETVAAELPTSPYYGYMTDLDMRARSHDAGTDNYIDAYIRAMQPFSEEEKQHMRRLVKNADELLKPFTNINAVPWRFVKLCCIMEGGFPHTQLTYIFVEQSFFLTKHWKEADQITTLIHEKIHVFQRLFPLQTHMLVQRAWGYRACGLLKSKPDARNNPDLNGLMFCHGGEPSYMAYGKDTPVHLNDCDVSGPDAHEHPFERMAYEISEHITMGKQMKDTEGTLQWMRSYF